MTAEERAGRIISGWNFVADDLLENLHESIRAAIAAESLRADDAEEKLAAMRLERERLINTLREVVYSAERVLDAAAREADSA